MSIVGKFFLHFGKEYLHTGEVVAQVDPATVLMRFDKCEHVPPATGAVMIAIPLARGGSNKIENIQLLCERCNLKKGVQDPFQWANKNGFLL